MLRPNIVFILADDLGVSDLGCYGRADHNTPNLDRLASEGMRFTSAYCAQPICSPSRAALLTGRTPARLHLTTYLPGRPDCPSQKLLHPKMQQQLPLDEMTLAELLKPAGYVSACIGKWHLGGKGFLPSDQGFDVSYIGQANTTPSATEGGKGEFDLTRQGIEFMRENRARPFFLYLTHNTPHINFTARTNLIESNKGAFNPLYAAVIESMDQSVGELLQAIDSLGLKTNTIVIFTSDNGGLHVPEGQHDKVTHNAPYRAGKGYLYEGGLRIPLIVRWPGKLAAGKTSAMPTVNTDWLPTLLEFAGVTAPTNLDGQSIADILRGASASGARQFFWHFPHYTNQGSKPGGAIRAGDWKLVEHYEDSRAELFALSKDISERNDVAAQHKDKVAQMRSALAEWRDRIGAQTNTINENFDAAAHARIYQDFDSSTFEPDRADPAAQRRVLEWRKEMNRAVQRGR